MPLPKGLARFNLVATNRVTGLVAGRLPGFAIVTHVGRRSGQVRHTPVNLFRDGDRYVIALTYGADSQWVRNVLAAGSCEVETRGGRVALDRPELVHDPEQTLVPRPVRPILRVIRVRDFLVLRKRAPTPAGSA
jgi:deazaflavin-dependent oxidoreductase (nitroreductase family)